MYAFQADSRQHVVAPFSFSGRPEDRTQRGSVISRTWATSPRLPLGRVPRSRTETLLRPKQACSHLHLYPNISQNGWIRTSVLLPPRQARYQTSLRSESSSPYGNRTHLSALKERYPSPIDERAVVNKVSFSASSILTRRWPSLHCLLDSTRSAHGRVRPFIAFTPVVDVSIAQQQAVVQRVFWVWLECPVEHSRLARPAFYSGK